MNIEQFLKKSYTAYHATENAVNMLEEAGFVRLGSDKWNIERGGKYYITKNGSSVIAFSVGSNDVFNVAISHTDSPSLKVKGNALVPSESVKRLNVERYGGALLYTFLDRPLKIAGRLVLKTEQGVKTKNVVSNFNVVVPSLCIHHNPTANENLSLNAQVDMLPLYGQGEGNLYEKLATEQVLDADLFAVPDCPPFYAGAEDEFLCSPRLDNLTSVYGCIRGVTECVPKNIAVAACFDNEEVGSDTRQGGGSDFLGETLRRIALALGLDEQQYFAARENGYILSVDNGHAVHPAHPEKSDPTQRVHMNGGIVIKHHVNYSTDGLTSAMLKRLLDEAGIAYQDYYNRSDMRCGSTIGLQAASNLSMKACDIGLAQLAMHSACETVGANDVETMAQCVKTFLGAEIDGDEETFTIK